MRDLHIEQIPITVKKLVEVGGTTPWDTRDLPAEIPIQVSGWMTYVHQGGETTPCWLLLGKTGVHPVAMSRVVPHSWGPIDPDAADSKYVGGHSCTSDCRSHFRGCARHDTGSDTTECTCEGGA